MEKSDFAAAFGRETACIAGRCAVAVWSGWQTLFPTKMFARQTFPRGKVWSRQLGVDY
jgi:hypothetical protein